MERLDLAAAMDSIKELAEAIDRDKVLRARQREPGAKLLDALEMYDFACSFTLAGIQAQHPGVDDAEAKRILTERQRKARERDAQAWKLRDTLLP
jgi:hypothetical protein